LGADPDRCGGEPDITEKLLTGYQAGWRVQRAFVFVPARDFVSQQTYAQFPPRAKTGTFNLDAVIDKLTEARSEGQH
jgi:hypothetical protein